MSFKLARMMCICIVLIIITLTWTLPKLCLFHFTYLLYKKKKNLFSWRHYSNKSKRCHLCLTEKLYLVRAKKPSLLNKRTELISKCRHENKLSAVSSPLFFRALTPLYPSSSLEQILRETKRFNQENWPHKSWQGIVIYAFTWLKTSYVH